MPTNTLPADWPTCECGCGQPVRADRQKSPRRFVYGHAGRYKRPSLPERFWERVEKTEGCWLWRGGRHGPNSYGRFSMGTGNQTYAHRYAYELLVGPIPPEMSLHHRCGNRGCVNPAHLEPMPQGEHMRLHAPSLQRAPKTHCKRGHPLVEGNLASAPNGWRRCRACMNMRQRKAWKERKAA